MKGAEAVAGAALVVRAGAAPAGQVVGAAGEQAVGAMEEPEEEDACSYSL